jgi:hypothetical protein
MKTILHP